MIKDIIEEEMPNLSRDVLFMDLVLLDVMQEHYKETKCGFAVSGGQSLIFVDDNKEVSN